MDENEKRKDRNKRMLQAIGVTGGGALLVVIAFTLLIVFTANPKNKEKESNNEPSNAVQYRIDNSENEQNILTFNEK